MTNRVTVYVNEVPFDTDILLSNKNSYVGVGKLSAAILGEGTLVNKLACVPTSPLSLGVDVNPGEIYSLGATDATPYGSLIADARLLYKQGILLDKNTFSTPAPGTGGYSINYLVQAIFSEADATPTSRPYFNSADPSTPLFLSATGSRNDLCVLTLKTGVAAPTGTQVTPTPDAGNTGIWVVTVANGQTTVTSGDISVYPSAPFISEKLGDKIGLATGDARYARIQQVQFYSGVVNGGMNVAQRQNLTIANNVDAIGLVDAMSCKVSATTVTAGTLTQGTANSYGSSGNSTKVSGLTTTGATTVALETRIESLDAVNYRNAAASFGCIIAHDFGSTVNFTVQLTKADAVNDFTTFTSIATSSVIAVPTGTPTWVKFENVSMGACGNGVGCIVSTTMTALTTKNLNITDVQLNQGSFAIPFIPKEVTIDKVACMKRYRKTYQDGQPVGAVNILTGFTSAIAATTTVGGAAATTTMFPGMLYTPVVNIYNPVTGTLNNMRAATGGGNVNGAASDISSTQFVASNTAGVSDGVGYSWHWEAISDL